MVEMMVLRKGSGRDDGSHTFVLSILVICRVGQTFFSKERNVLAFFSFFSKERNVLAFFCVLYKKNAVFFAFFYVLYKIMRRSLHSFTFFIKECGVLCVLLRSL